MIAATAAVFTEPGSPLTVEALTLEDPRAGEVRVRLGASGICHSDLYVRDGEWSAPTPLVLGHEGAGVVDAIGDGVRDVAVGDHVVLSWMYPCRRCRACAAGRAWACTGSRSEEYLLEDGTTRLRRGDGTVVYPRLAVGTFAGHTVVPESAAVRIPDAVPFDVAALIGCAVTTGVGAVLNTARVPAGASAVVIGCGGVGLAVVMGLALVGAYPIIAVDLADDRLELARELGATHTVRDARRSTSRALPTSTSPAASHPTASSVTGSGSPRWTPRSARCGVARGCARSSSTRDPLRRRGAGPRRPGRSSRARRMSRRDGRSAGGGGVPTCGG